MLKDKDVNPLIALWLELFFDVSFVAGPKKTAQANDTHNTTHAHTHTRAHAQQHNEIIVIKKSKYYYKSSVNEQQ